MTSALVAVFFLPTRGDAETSPQSTGPVHVRVQTEVVEMSLETYTALMGGEPGESIHLRAQTLLKNKQAKLVNSQMLISRSGEKSALECVREMITPTDYDYGDGLDFYSPMADGKTQEDLAWPQLIRPYLSCPVAFEVRNVGATLEVEPTYHGKMIDLRFSHDWVFFPSLVTWQTHRDHWGVADVKMPTYTSQRCHLALTLLDNQYQCVTVYTPTHANGEADPSRKQLLFVKASLIHLDAPLIP